MSNMPWNEGPYASPDKGQARYQPRSAQRTAQQPTGEARLRAAFDAVTPSAADKDRMLAGILGPTSGARPSTGSAYATSRPATTTRQPLAWENAPTPEPAPAAGTAYDQRPSARATKPFTLSWQPIVAAVAAVLVIAVGIGIWGGAAGNKSERDLAAGGTADMTVEAEESMALDAAAAPVESKQAAEPAIPEDPRRAAAAVTAGMSSDELAWLLSSKTALIFCIDESDGVYLLGNLGDPIEIGLVGNFLGQWMVSDSLYENSAYEYTTSVFELRGIDPSEAVAVYLLGQWTSNQRDSVGNYYIYEKMG